MKAYNLKTNRLAHAIGIDAGRPILSWIIDGGIRQTAFRVQMKIGNKPFYTSGEIFSSETSYSPGVFIKSRTRVE